MKKILQFGIALITILNAKAQQDAQFSQHMFNHLSVNPAVAGINRGICARMFYRSQWVGFEGAPSTFLFSSDAYVPSLSGGLGIILFNDKIGFEKNTEAKVAYSFQRVLLKGVLGMGIDLGVLQKSISGTWIAPNTLNGDASIPAPSINDATYDAGVGLSFVNEKIYIGLSTTHLPESNIKQGTVKFKNQMHHYLTASWYQNLNPSLVLNPSIYAKSDNASTQIDISLRLILNSNFWGGVSYRLNDAFVVMAGFRRDDWTFGYSFDITTSDIRKYSSNTHELFIAYCHKFKEVHSSHSNPRHMW